MEALEQRPSERPPPKFFRCAEQLNEAYFAKHALDALRGYQTDCVRALKKVNIGQACLPTGTGKTFIQKTLIVSNMIEHSKENATSVSVIAAHRLVLCTQLLEELLELAIPAGIKLNLLYIGTGNYDIASTRSYFATKNFNITNVKFVQTTATEDIKRAYENTKNEGRQLLIVSTYDSFALLSTLPTINICCFDEAHTTVEDDFTANIQKVKPNIHKQYFFTATRKVEGQTGGQNNEAFYGPLIYELSPKKAVELGEIVPPCIHTVTIPEGNEIATIMHSITSAFEEHKKHLNAELAPKILVTADGLDSVHEVIANTEFKAWCTENKIRCMSFSSKQHDTIDFVEKDRDTTIKTLRGLADHESAVFFHYDILTEGIDLPNITGVFLMRKLGTTKLLQNIGRGARLLKRDRTCLYEGTLQPLDFPKFIKPYCWVILPKYMLKENTESITEMIKVLRDTYNTPYEQLAFVDKSNSKIEQNLPSNLDQQLPLFSDDVELNHIIEEQACNTYIRQLSTLTNNARKQGILNLIKKEL